MNFKILVDLRNTFFFLISRKYFTAYLHDVADVLLYLLTPAEDFRSRPFRFLVREVFVKRILLPLFDMLSDPDFINYSIVRLVSGFFLFRFRLI